MYQFTEDCLLGIETIDNEHRMLFQLLNETMELMEQGGNTRAIGKNLLQRLEEYAQSHFAHYNVSINSINKDYIQLAFEMSSKMYIHRLQCRDPHLR